MERGNKRGEACKFLASNPDNISVQGVIMAFTPIDITSHVSQQKANVSVRVVQNALAEAFDKICAAAVDKDEQKLTIEFKKQMMRWTDVIDTDGQQCDLMTFVTKAKDTSKAKLLENVARNTDIVSKELIIKVGENLARLKRDPKAEILRPVLDLRKVAKNNGNNIAIAQGPVNSQDINNPNKKVNEKDNASTMDDKENGKFVCSEKGLLKMLEDMCYLEKTVVGRTE